MFSQFRALIIHSDKQINNQIKEYLDQKIIFAIKLFNTLIYKTIMIITIMIVLLSKITFQESKQKILSFKQN